MPPDSWDRAARLLAGARTAVLATIDDDGRPRLVPICFIALDDGARRDGSRDVANDRAWPVIYSPIDDKPKTGIDPLSLARVRDVLARPAVTLLVDRWDEDWSRLAWLRLHGTATLLDPSSEDAAAERTGAIVALRAKYPQYADHRLESRPIIRIAVTRASSWEATGTGIATDRP